MTDDGRPNPGAMVRGLADRLLSRASDVVDDVVASDAFSFTLARGMALSAATTAAVPSPRSPASSA